MHNWKWIAVVFGIAAGIGLALAYEQAAFAQYKVDQGRPGDQGGWVVKGDVANDGADTGNPVKIGGRADTTTPTAVADGDRVNAWFTERGGFVAEGTADTDAAVVGRPVYIGSRASAADPTAVSADGDVVPLWLSQRGEVVVNHPTCDGTVVNIATSTTTATGTTTDRTLYMVSVRGTGSMCIWGGTATTTTGFWAPVDSVIYQRAEGTSLSCITVAGTGNVFATPCDYGN